MKRRGCTACCAFKKSGGIAAPPLLGNSVCLGKLPADGPGASLLGGRWPCPGLPAVRWPWAPETPAATPLAAHRKMPPDLPAALPGAGAEPLGRQLRGRRYARCWGQGDAGVTRGHVGGGMGHVLGRKLGSVPSEHRHQWGGWGTA